MTRRLLALLIVVCSTLSVVAPVGAQGPPTDAQLLRELGAQRVVRHPDSGRIRLLGASPQRPMPRVAAIPSSASPERAARGFMQRYGQLFGVSRQPADLRVIKDRAASEGRALVRFQQLHRGVPVIGAELNVQLDSARNVLVANGEASPNLTIDVQPLTTAANARSSALSATTKAHRLPQGRLSATIPQLWVYDPARLGIPDRHGVRLVWRSEVTAGPLDPIRELVLVDAKAGGIVLHFNQVADAKTRYICDRNNVKGAAATCTSGYIRSEGQAAVAGRNEVNRAYDHSGTVYDWYRAMFGRDSLDAHGMALRSTVRYCPPLSEYEYACTQADPYPNAFWNGQNMVYGDGFAAADDVVGHELTHGVTNFESNLFYYFQSGAINEALSDIFGELIDQYRDHGTYDDDSAAAKWYMGEDAPPVFGPSPYRGALRSMADPTLFEAPDSMTSPYYQSLPPEEPGFDNGGVHTNSGVANKAAYLMAQGGTFNGSTVTALGNTKTAHIWYEVETNLLTSGSDYADLAAALEQACYSLTGIAAITAANCVEVSDAVAATEMRLQPTDPIAQAPEAPVCDTGAPKNTYFEDVPSVAGVSDWSITSLSGNPQWHVVEAYATSGSLAFTADDAATTTDSAIQMVSGVVIPANAFLHFRHAFETENYYNFSTGGYDAYDAGIVEYSTNGGTSWSDLSSLFTDNGYNVRLDPNHVSDNPLGFNRMVFGSFSSGYMSSRANLSGLAGQTVKFRWRFASDSSTPWWLGWLVDDIRIYTCVTGSDVAVSAASDTPDPLKVGEAQTLNATIKNNGPAAATGTSIRFLLTSNQAFLSGPAGCTLSGGSAITGGKLGGTVICTTGTLASGATAARAIKVGVVGAAKLRVKISALTTSSDSKATNNVRYVETVATYPAGQTTKCTIIGNSLANTLNGTSAANTLCGFAGNDTINGLAGNDTLNGGSGADNLNGGDGNDKLFGLTGVDNFNGGTGTDSCPDAVAGEPKVSCP
jgi:bacillolysin